MAVGSHGESAYTVKVHSRMTRFKMHDARATPPPPPPRERNGEPRPCLVVRIRCSVRMSTETHLVGGATLKHASAERLEGPALRFPVHDPAVLRSEAACRAAVRRMLTGLPPLAGYYGHRAADARFWDRFVPRSLAAGIVARARRDDGVVAASSGRGGARPRRSRSYVCDVSMRVRFTSVYSEAKELLLLCEDAATGARSGGAGTAECAICMEDMAAGVVGLPGCSHAFHRWCIFKWFHRAATCPSCRHDTMNYLPKMSVSRLWHMLV